VSLNFDQMAFAIVQRVWGNAELDQPGLLIETRAVAEHLRNVWNARGAADIAAIDDVAHTNHAAVENAIRSLDR
jgi:hypothetical protein